LDHNSVLPQAFKIAVRCESEDVAGVYHQALLSFDSFNLIHSFVALLPWIVFLASSLHSNSLLFLSLNEVFEAMAWELHSKVLPLLTPCPNAKNRCGGGRDLWVLNPRAAMPEYVQGLEFLGQLLGLAVRTGDI